MHSTHRREESDLVDRNPKSSPSSPAGAEKTVWGNYMTREPKILKADDLWRKIADTRSRIVTEFTKLQRNRPDWVSGNDVRLVVAGNIDTALMCAELGIEAIRLGMGHDDWWNGDYPNLPTEARRIYRERFVDNLRIALLERTHSQVEHLMRSLVRSKGDEKLSRGSYRTIYDRILRQNEFGLSMPASDRGTALAVIKIMAYTRNTVHNNGMYRHPHSRTAQSPVTYQGVRYEFVDNTESDIMSWSMLVSLAEDAFEFVIEISDDTAFDSGAIDARAH